MVLDFFKQLGTTQIRLITDSLGNKETRQTYHQALIDYLLSFESELSEDSKRYLHGNPLCVLDSRDKRDQKFVTETPSILGYLGEPAQKHFDTVVSVLDTLAAPYEISSNMVRGLDYYTHTISEIIGDTPKMGAQATICTGGCYNNLVEELGGPPTPGLGFVMGIERLLLAMEVEGVVIPVSNEPDTYVVAFGNGINIEALKVVQTIRNFGLPVGRDFMNHKAKAQFKTADETNAKLVLMIGKDELANQMVSVKVVASRKEKSFLLEEIYEHFDEIYDEMTLFE